MARLHRTNRINRAGFTLVELLVAVSLIIVLLSLAVVFGPRFTNSQRVVSAADRASGWLLIAKQQAFRDNAPRGVRFLQNGTTGLWTEAQYIEAPEAYVPNPAQESNPAGGRIVFAHKTVGSNLALQTYFVADTNTISEFTQRVAVGDRLVLPEFGMSYQLNAIGAASQTAPTMVPPLAPLQYAVPLGLVSTPDLTASGANSPTTGFQGTLTTYKFGFQGQPRPVVGEPVLQLASGTLIDVQAASPFTSLNTGVVPGSTSFDILFSPSGQVLNNSNGLICLWVRGYDPTTELSLSPPAGTPYTLAQFEMIGEQSLVVISTRSGLISTQPINAPPGDPYLFAKDGLNSGL